MNIETNISIFREKTKFIANLSNEEFSNGDWVKYLPEGSNYIVTYTAKSGLLTIIDTPLLKINEREVN